MTSYVFTVINKRFVWEKLYEILHEKHDGNFEVVFALRESCPEKQELLELETKKKNTKVIVFDQGTSENKMVSESIKKTKGKQCVLCRDGFDFQTIYSDYLLAMGAHGAQVACFKRVKEKGKIKGFFSKLYYKLLKMIFGFTPYGGDVGLIYFSNIALDVLRSLPNNIALTKVNKWVGFDISYVTIDELKKTKYEKNEKKPLIFWTAVFAFVFLLGVTSFVLLSVFGKLGFSVGLLLVFATVVSAFLLLFSGLRLSVVCQYGDIKE